MLSKLLWLLCLVVLVLYGVSCVVVYWFECLFLVGCVVELWVRIGWVTLSVWCWCWSLLCLVCFCFSGYDYW